jgi:hypothetical protein
MSTEALLSNIIPFAGSGLLGYGFCFEKDPEVDASYCRVLGWDVLCWCPTIAKVWLCEFG